MTPRSGLFGATLDATGAAATRGRSTMGRCGVVNKSSTDTKDPATRRSRAITANGLSPLRFRVRNADTADSDAASHAR